MIKILNRTAKEDLPEMTVNLNDVRFIDFLPTCPQCKKIDNVLICFGGSDPKNFTLKTLQIIKDFKSGKQNRARFWISTQGKFIYIVYYAVHKENGEYLGTIEVTQDLTELRQITGERRLLAYDETPEIA